MVCQLKKRWNNFAKTNDGKNLWFLHKQGYRFCEYLKDLTPEQEMFLMVSNNLEVEESESDTQKRNQKKQSDLVQEKIRKYNNK